MRQLHSKAVLTIAVACASLPLSPSALAQGPGALEEVIVVARKREESLQDTPIAVTALGAEALRDANVRNTADLAMNVPGLDTRVGAKFATFSIRGVGARDNKTVATDSAVGVYVDNIFIARNDSQIIDVVDTQNIQVLRGPQGTLFGKNTAGGAMLVTTVKPQQELGGSVAVDIGNLERRNLRGSIDIPLVEDKLYSRFTIDSRQRDGYMDDAETRFSYGDEDKLAFVGQLAWYPSDNFSGNLMLFHSSVDEMAAPQSCRVARSGTILQTFTAPGDERLAEEACNRSEELRDRHKVINDREGVRWEMESTMAGLTLEWDVGNVTLKSITGWLHQDDINNWRDQDAMPLFAIQNIELVIDQLEANGIKVDEEREFISQEFQLQGEAFADQLNYTVGLFLANEQLDRNPAGQLISSAGFLGTPLPNGNVGVLPAPVAGFRGASLSSYENSTAAVFAQGDWNFNDHWQLTIGGRYGREDKEVDQNNYVSTETGPGLVSREEFDDLQGTIHNLVPHPTLANLSGEDDWNQFTPSLTLTYFGSDAALDATRTDSLMVYATYSEGFKAGGFVTFGDEFLSFDPETVANYELGIKLDALDSSLRFNAALYYMNYEDMQLAVTRQINDISTVPGIQNAGESTIQGLEFELTWLPNANWLLMFSGNFTDASYDEFNDLVRDPATGEFVDVDRSDEDFAYTPEQSFTVVGQYSWNNSWGDWAARLQGYYRDEVYIGLTAGAELSPFSYLDSYDLWNLRLAWQSTGKADVNVALYVDNLLDEEYEASGNVELSSQGSQTFVPGIQRTYGIQAEYRF